MTSSEPFQDSLYGDSGVLVATGRSVAALECNHAAGDGIGATTDGCPNFERGPGSVAQMTDDGSNGLLDVADLLRVFPWRRFQRSVVRMRCKGDNEHVTAR